MSMDVPFLDLKAQNESLRDELREAIDGVIEACQFAGGPAVAEFENDFADFCESERAVGVASGTDALILALMALDIEPGDEIVTAPNSFIATAEAISFVGAVPVFADVDPRYHTLDPEKVEAAITSRTRALIPVHLYGQTADMDPLLDIAHRNGLSVIEDACQAHGARYNGRLAGTMGHMGCFSFYPGKNLGAFGEAGAVVTGDGGLADRVASLRDHGQSKKYYHGEVGINGRMDGIQGAVLRVKLARLKTWNEARIRNAQLYDDLLAEVAWIQTPERAPYAGHVYHLYVVLVEKRDEVVKQLAERGINCGIHYPVPIHLQEAYAHLGKTRGAFPVAERSAEMALSLPMYPELAPEQIEAVVGALRAIDRVAA